MKTSRHSKLGASALAGFLLIISVACSSTPSSQATADGTTPTASAGTSSDPAAAATAKVAPYLKPETKITVTAPLTKAPTKGKKVYWLEGNIQSILPITGGFKEATAAIGYTLTTLTYDPADPQGPTAAMQQAVDAGADYIAVSGQTISILGTALQAAKAKNIPVIDLYSTDPVGGADNGIYADIGSAAYSNKAYPLESDLAISDAGGKANVLFVNIPDFDILKVADSAATGEFKSACPDCKVTPLNVSIADLTGGQVASQVVSALQSNTSINYVYLSIGDLAAGLPEALAAAGLADKAKIIGMVPNKDQIQALIDNKSFSYIPLPRPYSAWAAVDAMARLDTGMTIDQDQHSILPIEVWTNSNVPKPAKDYEGPVGYQDQFKALWAAK